MQQIPETREPEESARGAIKPPVTEPARDAREDLQTATFAEDAGADPNNYNTEVPLFNENAKNPLIRI